MQRAIGQTSGRKDIKSECCPAHTAVPWRQAEALKCVYAGTRVKPTLCCASVQPLPSKQLPASASKLLLNHVTIAAVHAVSGTVLQLALGVEHRCTCQASRAIAGPLPATIANVAALWQAQQASDAAKSNQALPL